MITHTSVLVNLARQLDSSDFNVDSQSISKFSLNSITDDVPIDKKEERMRQDELWQKRGVTNPNCSEIPLKKTKEKLLVVVNKGSLHTICWRRLCSPYFGGMIFWMALPIFSLQEVEIEPAFGRSGACVNAGAMGQRCEVVMRETCYCGGLKPVKKRQRLTYSDYPQVTCVQGEIMANCGDSEVKVWIRNAGWARLVCGKQNVLASGESLVKHCRDIAALQGAVTWGWCHSAHQ